MNQQLSILLAALSLGIGATHAQTAQVTFEPPKSGQPMQTTGGASRGSDCSQNLEHFRANVMPLIPVDQQGLTVAAHPTFFVYVPPTAAPKAFFSLQDEQGMSHYQTVIPLSQPGILSIELPESVSLAVGKNYRWYFVVMCDGTLRPDSPFVEGYVQRIEPEAALAAQLQGATPLEQATLYGQAGIWHETLVTLAELRRSQPDNPDIAASWEAVLSSVGLEAIASQPLIDISLKREASRARQPL
ncbi:MAG: DUF928 domain-containing protein [Cyanophyceae cyanobacterium]